MHAISKSLDSDRYARCICVSKHVRWDIDEEAEQRFVSQLQGWAYANMFGLAVTRQTPASRS